MDCECDINVLFGAAGILVNVAHRGDTWKVRVGGNWGIVNLPHVIFSPASGGIENTRRDREDIMRQGTTKLKT